ncbi:heavy metal translocating P-type ATPase [Clostridium kluyveri]|uniref:Cd(2+)-exporting ATPase n=1 Tax=Clostridium kluyveri TaxID=1534 RepID=A0A1L5F688_CLOKL|nr:heavy metal translocating P-type ATPase [Clostridium kluyveri]APM38526.1 ATPase P [Clostridium kluyveri]
MALNKNIPLFKCSVIHTMPGRVRVGCRAFQYLSKLNSKIEKNLTSMRAIKSAKINNITKNILIFYDKRLTSQDEILILLKEVVSKYSITVYKNEREDIGRRTSQVKEVREESTEDILKRVAVNAGTLSYSLITKQNWSLISGTSIFSKFTTIPALISIGLIAPLFKTGIGSFRYSLKPNADTLTIISIISSLLLGKDVSALTIIMLSDVAELLTAYTMEKTRDSIKNMIDLNEEYVWKQLEDKTVKRVLVKSIKEKDIVAIHTGEKVCVDGKVLSGVAVVDEASITGEFEPSVKRTGSYVFAGSIVKNGNVTVTTEKAGDNTVVSRIIHLVEEAASKKAPIQDYADKFASYLVPFNFAFAILTYFATKSAFKALNMLIIDYSCGIKLSTATAFSAAINTAVKNGVLIKGGNYIESLAKADTLIFDKTGTLTEGRPQIVSIISSDKTIKEEDIIKIAVTAEETSSHPMAKAVIRKSGQLDIGISKHGDIVTYVGRGNETTLEGKIVKVGNKAFMEESNIDTSQLESEEEMLISRGESIIYVSFDGKLIGLIGIQDKMRDNMRKTINNLRHKGIDEIILLTGDLKEQAEIVVDKMGIDSYEAELLPENKVQAVLKVQSQGSKTVMVGDGINDAPALAYANVGVALGGSSTDAALEASDISIQGNDPMMLTSVIDLSNKTMNIVRQNFGLVIGINSLGLVLSAAGVLPVFWGAVLHNSSTILVVSNSLRLLFHNMERGI